MLHPYPFECHYAKQSIAATYTFTTSRELTYRVYFIEVTKIIDVFDDYPVISNAMYLGIDLLTNKIASLDNRTGMTVSEIVRDYLGRYGNNTILVYNCDEKDGKQAKRNKTFHRWYERYLPDLDFEIFDKEILEETKEGVFVAQYLTLLYSKQHPRITKIRSEIAAISKWFDEDKD